MIQRLQSYAGSGVLLLRGILDVVRWPFERALWAIERRLLWPLREHGGPSRAQIRTAAFGGVGLLLAAAVAVGVVVAVEGGEEEPALVTAPAGVAATAPAPEPVPTEPVLEGATPDFTPTGSDVRTEVATADTVIATEGQSDTADDGGAAAASASSDGDEIVDPGPAAIEVARRFSGAFVLYETGRSDAKVREAISATASPQLAQALLRRPPRLPASVKVPQAKVLNVVPGPRHGSTYTLSASLLRVGITSELRMDVQRDETTDQWQVTDVLG
jgi:hypothetical protein